MMGGTLSMSGGGQIVLGANVYTYGAATLATIDAPINLNNASRTFTLSQGTPLYAAVEGSSGSSVGQFVAGGPLGQWTLAARRRDGPGRRQHPTDPKQRGPGTLCRQQRHFVLLAVQRADHRLDRQLHDVHAPNVYQTAQAIQTQLQTWFGAGNVLVTGTLSGTGATSGTQSQFLVTFVGQDAGTSVAPVQSTTLTGTNTTEACTIAFPYQSFAGSWTISYNGTASPTIAAAAPASAVQTAAFLGWSRGWSA